MATIAEPLAPGTIVGGRYRVEGLIGRGGFGAVFRATQLALDRPVALKAMIADPFDDGGALRFDREAELVQRLEHPNVVRLLDFGRTDGGLPYLVFELLEGRTLDEEIRRGGPLSPPRAARVAAQILKALMAAHARGIVHRDIKPANIFLSHFQGEPDFVKVLDFGIAKAADSRTLTQRGGAIGTPAYMAPEQVTGGEATPATDLYAVGLTLAEAITGEPVFKGASLVDIVREHLSPTPVPHTQRALQSPLGAVLHRATQKASERRYRSAAEMLADVEAASTRASHPGAHTPSAAFTAAPAFTAPPAAFTTPPVHAGALVPAPPARSRPKRGRATWVLVAAVGGALGLGAALAANALSTGKAKPRPAASAQASPAGADPNLEWLGLASEGTLVEVNANNDGVLDFVGYCSDPASQLCAVDGATFRPIWRRPVRIDRPLMGKAHLAVAGRSVVYVDPEGTAHVHDPATGAERGAVKLGIPAQSVCAPAEHPGKLWIETNDDRRLLLDPANRSVAATPVPASCDDDPGFEGCLNHFNPRKCKLEWLDPVSTDIELSQVAADRRHGVGFGAARGSSLPIAVGFTPGQTSKSAVRWRRPLGPGDGQSVLKLAPFVPPGLAGGRAVAAYDDTAGVTHLVTLDAASGKTLWDAALDTIPRGKAAGARFHWAVDVAITPTRVYVRAGPQLDVRDAATGRVLGFVGRRE